MDPDIHQEGERRSATPRMAVPTVIRGVSMVMEGEWRGLLAELPAVEAVGFKGATLEAEGPQEAVAAVSRVAEGEWRGLLTDLPAAEALGFRGVILEAVGPQEAVVAAEEGEKR